MSGKQCVRVQKEERQKEEVGTYKTKRDTTVLQGDNKQQSGEQ